MTITITGGTLLEDPTVVRYDIVGEFLVIGWESDLFPDPRIFILERQ